MKRAILIALILSPIAASIPSAHAGKKQRTTLVIREVAYVLPSSLNTLTEREARLLPPIAERASAANLAKPVYPISGALPRMATAPNPAQLISPLAPPRYGTGFNQVSYVSQEPYRIANPNVPRAQPNGISLFNVREIW